MSGGSIFLFSPWNLSSFLPMHHFQALLYFTLPQPGCFFGWRYRPLVHLYLWGLVTVFFSTLLFCCLVRHPMLLLADLLLGLLFRLFEVKGQSQIITYRVSFMATYRMFWKTFGLFGSSFQWQHFRQFWTSWFSCEFSPVVYSSWHFCSGLSVGRGKPHFIMSGTKDTRSRSN